MYDLFVSHNRKDKEWVRNFVSFLRFSGLTVFFDEDNIRFGADISTSISNAIENSRHVVLVLSSNSVKSDWVALEYAISLYSDPAAKEEKIIPIKLENIENTQIPLALRRLRFVDLTDGAEYSTRQLRALLNQLGVNDSNAIGIPSRISGSESRNSKYFFSTGRHPNIDETSASKFTRHYANLFRIRDVEIPYIPVFGGWEGGINEFTIGEICCFTDSEYIYSAPAEISSYADSEYEPLHGEELPNSVRLQGYNWLVGNQDVRKVPTFHFARVKYGDYRKISVILDKAIPFSNCTFRDKYAPTIEHQISESKLSNICGVGIFVITRDNQIVITRQSKNVTVYPEVWGYSASGAMDWMDNVDPFREIERESIEEISHKIDLENTILFQFGLDARNLFLQFTFFEFSLKNAKDIISKAHFARDFAAEKSGIDAIPFELTEIVNVIKSREWEPSAKSGLITLCTKKFGYDEVARALAPELSKCEMRDRAIAEWKKRSLREGDLPVMSARYPTSYCGEESKKYVESVLSFIGNDISNCRLLELGCGIGRFTQHFAKIAQTVTAVDLSQEMIDIAQKQLKGADNVTFLNAFIQDLNISATYDVAISSLVLIHNPDDDDFFDAIDALKKSAKVIFLFEHIDDSAQVSSFTKPRSERVLLECFQGFLVERKRKYKLFDDNILFLKLLKKMKNTA